MSNSIPNSPAELIALNEGAKFDSQDPNALTELIQELQDEYDPNPLQGLRAAQHLIEQLYHFHFNTVETADELELTPYQLQMWKDDTSLLKQAMLALRQINV